MQTITGSLVKKWKDKQHSFGQSIAVQGNTLVIGADDTPVNEQKYSGCVYVFKKENDEWKEKQILNYPFILTNSYYGWDVTISEDQQWIAVSADDDDTHAFCGGSVHIFKLEKNVYNLFQILYNTNNISEKSYFGFSVHIHNNEMLIGAPAYRTKKLDKNEPKSGIVKLYELFDGRWFYKKTFEPTIFDFYPQTFYGGNVRIADNFYAISAHREATGVVYIYDKKFKLIAKLSPIGSKYFGKSIAVYKDKLLVGSIGDNNEGKAYLYHKSIIKAVYAPSVAQNEPCFGYSVDIKSNKIAISDINSTRLKNQNLDWDGESKNPGYCYIYNNSTPEILYYNEKHFGHCVRLSEDEIFVGSPHINKVFIGKI